MYFYFLHSIIYKFINYRIRYLFVILEFVNLPIMYCNYKILPRIFCKPQIFKNQYYHSVLPATDCYSVISCIYLQNSVTHKIKISNELIYLHNAHLLLKHSRKEVRPNFKVNFRFFRGIESTKKRVLRYSQVS